MEINLNKANSFLACSFGNAEFFENRFDLLNDAIKRKPKNGLILEFGVWKGESINYIAEKNAESTVYGFDCFTGLPESWRSGFNQGCFSCDVPSVLLNVELVKGYFEDTLPNFLSHHKENISFIHLDCDLYSSAKTVLTLCGDRIVTGTIIVFDEYFNYPGWESHEHKAFLEFTLESEKNFEYFSLVPSGEQVGVVITP